MSSSIPSRLLRLFVVAPLFFSFGTHAQQTQLISGQNVNMVSGTEWPNGDPFLQRQNEPSIAVSTRNELHLLAGSNDYRSVDLPGLPEGKATGDSWMSVYYSYDGGGRWESTLLPGYPQDEPTNGSPIYGYEASADPVIRTGTHGLFYYAGIAFDRGESPKSAGFIGRYIDLNNNERDGSIEYLGMSLYDTSAPGDAFIDKPWIAVDKPRSGALTKTIDVNGVQQTVQCGNLYVAWARITGDGVSASSSDLMFTRSTDCGETFDTPTVLSSANTINQGASIAVNPVDGRVQVAWRQFQNTTMSCVEKGKYWRDNPDAWPVDQIELAGYTLEAATSGTVIVNDADSDDDHDYNGTNGQNDDDSDSHGDSDDDDSDVNFEYDWDDDADKPNGVLRQLLSAWLNVLSGADKSEIEDILAETEQWLVDNPLGSKPRKAVKKRGNQLRKILRNYNKGKLNVPSCKSVQSMGTGGTMNPNAIMTVHSTDSGDSFSSPVVVSGDNYFPFEQGTTEYSFRSTGYPTMTFDGDGRAYIAFTTRGLAVPDFDEVGGDGRIVVTTSNDGSNWTFPLPIDEPEQRGHQLMPALEFSRGKVFMLYYDFRDDLSGNFDRFITDFNVDPSVPRHTVDVRAAQADAADVPEFTNYSVVDQGSTQTSRYPYVLVGGNPDPESLQTQYNPPNLPMFQGGLVPFFGDFIDIAAVHFVRNDQGEWDFDTDPANGSPVVHAVWTDNRDVVPPLDGDWTSYVPPGNNGGAASIFDPNQTVPVCTPGVTGPDRTKMRNQNIYTSRLTQGLAVAVPGNNRPLGTIQRAFVGFVQNLTSEDKRFRLEILNQPLGGVASFKQFELLTSTEEAVESNSSISRSIYVSSTDPSAEVEVLVTEIDQFGSPVTDGLTGIARINPDPTAPAPSDNSVLNAENYTPAVFNPAVFNPAVFNSALLGGDPNVGIYSADLFPDSEPTTDEEKTLAALQQMALLNPAVFNPAIFNPAVFNPAVFNPAVFNPAVFNPAVFNPAVFNPAVFNPAVFNPAVFNPAVFNPAVFNPAVFNTSLVETSVVVENQGNTTAAYSVNLDLEQPPEGFLFQVMVYKTYQVPTVVGCDVKLETVQEQLVNQLTPNVDGSLLDPNSTSFYIPPGDNVLVSVRIVPDPNNQGGLGDPGTLTSLPTLDLSQSIVPQAVDTTSAENGETEPTPITILAPSVPVLVINAVSLPNAAVGDGYMYTLGTTGGNGSAVSWSLAPGSTPLPPGLTLDPSSGTLSGTPGIGTQGLYTLTVRAKDNDQTAQQAFSLEILPGGVVVTSTRFAETVIVNDSSILNDGTLIVANDLGDAPSPVTLANGLTFGTDQTGFTGPNVGPGGGDFFFVDPLSNNPPSAELDAILSDLRYRSSLGTVSATIGGLTNGQNYRLQLLFSNDVNNTGNQIAVTVDGTTHILNNWQPDAINLVVDFVASGSSVVLEMAQDPAFTGTGGLGATAPGRPILNAYALHQVDYLVDQQQLSIDSTVGGLAVQDGGQRLAQIVTAGITGTLDEVGVPLACASGNLLLQIQGINASGVPNGIILSEEYYSGDELPNFVGGAYGDAVFFLRPLRFRFNSPPQFNAGEKYAIVLQGIDAGSGSDCGIFRGPVGDSYLGGDGLYQDQLQDWLPLTGGREDLPFITKVTPTAPIAGTAWQADFDLNNSASPDPAGYECLRIGFQYDNLPANESMFVTVYNDFNDDSDNTPVSDGDNISLSFATTNVASEFFLDYFPNPPYQQLTDQVGLLRIFFSVPVRLTSVGLEGRSGQCIGGDETGFVESSLTRFPVFLQ